MEPLFNLQRPVNGIVTSTYPKSVFQPLPPPTGKLPFHLNISKIISPADFNKINKSKKMIFHLAADVGGVKNPQDQLLVTDHMEMQFDKFKPDNNPSFL